jgi:hypothetical protein
MPEAPTPYPEINAVLAALLAGARRVLGEDLSGLYLAGSLALGDFEPGRSDIDFFAVTQRALPAERLPALASMHAELFASGAPWARVLEGSYIPRRALRRYDPRDAEYPALRVDGSFAVDFHGSDANLQRWVLREHGIVLYGPDPRTLLDPISAAQLRESASGILREWWLPQLDDPHRLYSPEYQAYAVLTMCRIAYTIARGEVVSKPAAARWARQHLNPRWHALIERALAWRHGDEMDALVEVLEMIRGVGE